METFWQDLRYGARTLLKHPGFTIVAVLTLALGIGANTAIFSVVNGVLLRPLPFPEPERLTLLFEDNRRQGWPEDVTSFETFRDWRNRSKSFQEMAGFIGWNPNLTGSGDPEGVAGMLVTTRFFNVLGAKPLLGRTIVDGEDRQGNDAVTVLSHGYWVRRFGGDRKVVGRIINLNGTPHTVIGVMPKGFAVQGREIDLWAPLTTFPDVPRDRGSHYMQVIGRLKEGITPEKARSEMEGIMRGLEKEYPQMYAGFGATVVPLDHFLTRSIRPALLVLAGSVLLVLLIACANVANLLLARATTRQREIAIRTALGAGRWRLVRQMLTESILLALAGGGLGLLLAIWGIDLLNALRPANILRLEEIGLDSSMLFFTLGLSLLTGTIFGLLPALRASSSGLSLRLKEGGRTYGDGPRGIRVRNILVVGELALSLILLIGAGLLLRSFILLQGVDPGFKSENLITFRVGLPAQAGYQERERRIAFVRDMEERLKNIPGVESAASVLLVPFTKFIISGYPRIEGAPVVPVEQRYEVRQNSVSGSYFTTMGIPLVAGRTFTARDADTNAPVIIINEAMANRFWPGENPIGKRMTWEEGPSPSRWMEVVGVVANILHDGLDDTPGPEVYMPYMITAAPMMSFVIRTPSDLEGTISAVRRELRALDPNLPLNAPSTMDQQLERSFADRRFTMTLLAIFAAMALVLASIGIYGLLAYTVEQRTREIGIRIALGAGRKDLLRMVLRQGLLLVIPGVLLGAAVAAALTHLLSSLLFNVSAIDPITFIAISVLLIVVGLIACYIPARRATGVDPIVALRYE